MIPLVITKTISCLIVFLLNSIVALSAFLFTYNRCGTGQLAHSAPFSVLSYANCFSVGLFLAVCLMGLYNSSVKKMLAVQQSLRENHPFRSYPISEAMLCLGLFILWFLECLFRTSLVRETPKQLRPSMDCFESSDQASSFEIDDDPASDRVVLLSDYDLPSTEQRVRRSIIGTASSSFLRAVFLVSAMSMHTVLEAIGFGLLDTFSQVFSMAIGMGLHQFLCSLTLGMRLAQIKSSLTRHRVTLALLVGYLLLLPIGVLIGSAIHSTQANISSSACVQPNATCPTSNPSVGVVATTAALQNFAAATFLYVIFVEILPGELPGMISTGSCMFHHHPSTVKTVLHAKQGLLRCFCAFLGFILIAGIRFVKHS